MEIHFGLLEKPLGQQLNALHLLYDKDTIQRLENVRVAIGTVYIANIVSHTVYLLMLKKLSKEVKKHVDLTNKPRKPPRK